MLFALRITFIKFETKKNNVISLIDRKNVIIEPYLKIIMSLK